MASPLTYNPGIDSIVLARAVGALYYSIDGRSTYPDTDRFVRRPFQSLEFVKSYFNNEEFRRGMFSIYVNETGTLNESTGYIDGGVTKEYWWKEEDLSDEGLVEKTSDLTDFATLTYVNEQIADLVVDINANTSAIAAETARAIAVEATKANINDILSNVNITYDDLDSDTHTKYTNLLFANQSVTLQTLVAGSYGAIYPELEFSSLGVLDLTFLSPDSNFFATIQGVVVGLGNYVNNDVFNNTIATITNGNNNFFKVTAEKDILFVLDKGKGDYASYRYARAFYADNTTPIEDFMKGWEQSLYKSYIQQNYDYVTDGVLSGIGTNNHYATTVGTKVFKKFSGTGISINHLCTSVGGLWEAYVDGVFITNISTFGAGEARIDLISNSFKIGDHLLMLVFTGEDPDHPTATPRGWIRFSNNNSVTYSFRISGTSNMSNLVFSKEFDFMVGFSNKEFAFSVRDFDGGDAEFFPSHDYIPTTNLGSNGIQEVYLDGINVDIDSINDYTQFSEAVFIQKMECKLTGDTTPRMDLKFVVTMKDGRCHNYMEFIVRKRSIITAGYVFQMPLLNGYVDQVVSSFKERIEKNTTITGNTYFIKPNIKSAVVTSNNLLQSEYCSSIVITDKSSDIGELFLQHRNDSSGDPYMQKLYPKPYSSFEVNIGDVLYFDGYYEVTKFPYGNEIFGS